MSNMLGKLSATLELAARDTPLSQLTSAPLDLNRFKSPFVALCTLEGVFFAY